MSKVFVLDTKKRPLDPIHSAQARQLLNIVTGLKQSAIPRNMWMVRINVCMNKINQFFIKC
jgi:hypothetical protein